MNGPYTYRDMHERVRSSTSAQRACAGGRHLMHGVGVGVARYKRACAEASRTQFSPSNQHDWTHLEIITVYCEKVIKSSATQRDRVIIVSECVCDIYIL